MDEIKSKLNRATELVEELQAAIAEYHKSDPYQVKVKMDPETRRLIYYVSDVKDVPEKIKLLVGDIIQNLRSSLDHLAYRLFIVAGGSSTSARHIYFPIAEDEATFNSPDTQRKIKGIVQTAVDRIHAIKPYRGGNDVLWQIHELNNRDKHRLLLTAGASFGSMDIAAHMREGFKKFFEETGAILPSIFVEPAEKKFPLKVGDELFIDGPDAKPNLHMNFNFKILLSEPGIVEGKMLLPTMRSMVDEVEGVLGNFSDLV